jgi:hypothetical protein
MPIRMKQALKFAACLAMGHSYPRTIPGLMACYEQFLEGREMQVPPPFN